MLPASTAGWRVTGLVTPVASSRIGTRPRSGRTWQRAAIAVGAVVAALGARVRVADGTMEDALAQSDIVVCAASGAVLEAMLAGKRVIRVSPESQLDMDPLGWFAELDPPVTSPQDLARRLAEALSAARPAAEVSGNGLSSFFAPPTEENMEAFLPAPERAAS